MRNSHEIIQIHKNKEKLSYYYLDYSKNFIAGTFAGACESFLGHPLDTIKAKLQTQHAHSLKYKGSYDCLRQTIQKDGFLAIYNGVGSQLIRSSLSTSVLFGVMSYFRNVFNVNENNIISINLLAASTCTALIEAATYTPFEVVKVRMQTLAKGTNMTSWRCAKEILRKHGLKSGLYRGFNVTVKREILGNMFYFGSYETIKKKLSDYRKRTNIYSSNLNNNHMNHYELNKLDIAFAGGLAGICYWAGIYPLDTLKTLVQSDNLKNPTYSRGTFHSTLSIIKNDGVLRLYSGITPSLIRAFPANAVVFLSYETALYYIESCIIKR